MDAITVLVLLAALVNVNGQQLLSVEPKVSVLVAGQHLELTCASLFLNPHMKWTLVSMEDGTADTIADGTQATPNVGPGAQFSVTVTETESHVQSVLRVDGITIREGGFFRCEDLSQPSVSPKQASVVVLGSDPVCASTPEAPVDGETVTFNCQLHCTGQWRPSMEWTGPQGVIAEEKLIEDSRVDLLSVSYQMVATRAMDGSLVSSRTFFTNPDLEPLPYTFTHHFQPLFVQYSATNISVHPQKNVYNPGDRVTCISDGQPAPSLEWRDDESILRCQGAVLLISKEMEGHRSFSCVASSSIRGRVSYTRKTMKLFVHADEAASPTEEDIEEDLCVMPPLIEKSTTSREGLVTTEFIASADTLESRQEAKDSNLLIPIAVASTALLLVVAGVACYCSTKHRRQKQSLESGQNLNNDVYLRTCGGDARGCAQPNHAQPNQYATQFGVQDLENGAMAAFNAKKGTEEDDFDDNSSGFYSELIVPEDLPSKSQTPEPPALRRGLSQVSQDIGEDGYLMPQIVR